MPALISAVGHTTIYRMWPPPQPTCSGVLPDHLVKEKTMGRMYQKLREALHHAGYKVVKVDPLEKGFTLMTRQERIDDDGKPLEKDRWSVVGKPLPETTMDYWWSFLRGVSSRFQLLLFVVTPVAALPPGGEPLPTAAKAMVVYSGGGNVFHEERKPVSA